MDTTRKLVAEAIGTFFLCFAGIAAILSTRRRSTAAPGWSASRWHMAWRCRSRSACFGGISGGHHNPAVTLGFLSTGRIAPPLAVLYIVSQLIGAIVAAAACKAIFPAVGGRSGQARHSAAARSAGERAGDGRRSCCWPSSS